MESFFQKSCVTHQLSFRNKSLLDDLLVLKYRPIKSFIIDE